MASSMSARMRRVRTRKVSPAAVSTSPLARRRTNSGVPSLRSRLPIEVDTADCATCSDAAASFMLDSSAQRAK